MNEQLKSPIYQESLRMHSHGEDGENRCFEEHQQGFQGDVLRQTVRGMSSSNQKCQATNGGKAHTTANQ